MSVHIPTGMRFSAPSINFVPSFIAAQGSDEIGQRMVLMSSEPLVSVNRFNHCFRDVEQNPISIHGQEMGHEGFIPVAKRAHGWENLDDNT